MEVSLFKVADVVAEHRSLKAAAKSLGVKYRDLREYLQRNLDHEKGQKYHIAAQNYLESNPPRSGGELFWIDEIWDI